MPTDSRTLSPAGEAAARRLSRTTPCSYQDIRLMMLRCGEVITSEADILKILKYAARRHVGIESAAATLFAEPRS